MISVFKNRHNEIVIAWHNDDDSRWSFAEKGFDTSLMDLIEDYWGQDVISNPEYRDIFYQLNEFSDIPEKLRKAVVDFIENPKGLSTKSYQNIYHNLYKKDVEDLELIAKKYSQKAQVLKFLKDYGFTKLEIANET
jgi:lysine/ornithine N-monooxygenase